MWTKGGCIGFKPKQYRNVNDSMRSRVGAGKGEGEVRTTFLSIPSITISSVTTPLGRLFQSLNRNLQLLFEIYKKKLTFLLNKLILSPVE